MVIGTTSNQEVLRDMGFLEAVSAVLHVPSLSAGVQVRKVLTELGGFSPSDLQEIESGWIGNVEMKRLIMLAEMAKQLAQDVGPSGTSLGKRFLDMHALRG